MQPVNCAMAVWMQYVSAEEAAPSVYSSAGTAEKNVRSAPTEVFAENAASALTAWAAREIIATTVISVSIVCRPSVPVVRAVRNVRSFARNAMISV